MSQPKYYTSKHHEDDLERLKQGPDRKCNSCAHVSVCTYLRGAVRLIKSEEGGDGIGRPFEPEDIAKICQFYTFKTTGQEISR